NQSLCMATTNTSTSNPTEIHEGSELNINSPLVIAIIAIMVIVLIIGVIVIVFFILRYKNKSASPSSKARGLRKFRIGSEARDDGHTHKKRDSDVILDLEGKEESFEESYAEGAVGHQQHQMGGRSMPVRSQTIYGTQPPSTSTIDLQSSTIQ
ncbi:19900_t:CDS:1, partial [Racocetra persica]